MNDEDTDELPLPLPAVGQGVPFAKFNTNGQYWMTGIAPEGSITLQEPDVYIGVVDMNTQYHDPFEKKPVSLPPKPAGNGEFDFDWTNKMWRSNIARCRAIKHAAIEAERDRRLRDPEIVYDGKLLDADPQAKQNLQDKVTAVSSRLARNRFTPPQMLVWRDRENNMHAFPDLATYKAWLEGFVIALEERGMQAWAWSWQKKDQLRSLTTYQQVEDFDPTS